MKYYRDKFPRYFVFLNNTNCKIERCKNSLTIPRVSWILCSTLQLFQNHQPTCILRAKRNHLHVTRDHPVYNLFVYSFEKKFPHVYLTPTSVSLQHSFPAIISLSLRVGFPLIVLPASKTQYLTRTQTQGRIYIDPIVHTYTRSHTTHAVYTHTTPVNYKLQGNARTQYAVQY